MPKSTSKLTPNEKIFADEWLVDRNGTRSYRVAYKRCKNDNVAAASAAKLLRKPRVAAYINTRLAKLSKKLEISTERVLQEYAKIAFLDPAELFDDNGNLISIKDLPKEVSAAIGGIDQLIRVTVGSDGVPDEETTKKIKLIDKVKALDALSKHLGLFEKDNSQQNEGMKELAKAMANMPPKFDTIEEWVEWKNQEDAKKRDL